MANMLLIAAFAVLAFSAQGRRVDRGVAQSIHRDKGKVNATGNAKVEEMCAGIDPFASYDFMENVLGLDDYLFGIFGDGLALAADHQFMIFQARDKGSSKIGAADGEGTWKGLDYYFVKGPLCEMRCNNNLPKCCNNEDPQTGKPSWYSEADIASSKAKVAHGDNRPTYAGKVAVIGAPWYQTNTFAPKGLGVTFTFEALDGKVVAKGPTVQGGENDCVVRYVHCCESNLKKGMYFEPTKFDIVGSADGTADSPACLVYHTM